MNKHIDTRRLSSEQQQEIRTQIIRKRLQGTANRVIAASLGVSERHASMVWQRFQKKGGGAILLKPRGRKGGSIKISVAQEIKIRNLLLEQPKQFGYPNELWTREIMRAVVNRALKAELSLRTIGGYLSKWRMNSRKPIVLTAINNPPDLQKWIYGEYQNISDRAKAERAVICWYVESSRRKPVIRQETWNAKPQLCMIAAITNQGQIRFMITDGSLTDQIRYQFLLRLISDAGRKIFLFAAYNPTGIHSTEMKEWFNQRKNVIELFNQPFPE